MNQSKTVLAKIALICLIAFALIAFQAHSAQRFAEMETQIAALRNEVYNVNNMISQQNAMIMEENSDYIFYGLTFENEKLSATTGVLAMKMNLTFTKLPSDAKVFIELQGSKDHYPLAKTEPGLSVQLPIDAMQYGDKQTIEFRPDGLNLFSSDMNFDIGQNYKLTLVVETAEETFSEPLGIIPALEWSEPAHYATVEIVTLSADSKTGNFKYKMSLVPLSEMNDGFTFYDEKNLYDFEKLKGANNKDQGVTTEVVNAHYRITYLDKVIKEGDMRANFNPETGSSWEVEDQVKFEIDPSSDFEKALQIEFTTEDENGKKSTFTRGVF